MPLRTAYGDACQFQRCADAGCQLHCLVLDQPYHLTAHDAAAEHRHPERLHRATSNRSRSSSVSRRISTDVCPLWTETTGGRGMWL